MFARAITLLLMALSPPTIAETVYRCVGPDGVMIFSHFACQDASAGEKIKIKVGSEGMRIADPAVPEQPEEEDGARGNGGVRITVVGGAGKSKCSDASEQEIRTAVVKNQVFPGMSADDAVKSWGKPSKINRSSHGTDQWVYYRGDYSAQYLYVDTAGCVKSWN